MNCGDFKPSGTQVAGAALALALTLMASLATAKPEPGRLPPDRESASTNLTYVVRYDHWTEADERAFGEFITGIGDSGCRTVDACLTGTANPFRTSDPEGMHFKSDCADLPYYLRAYFAWKHGLPFAYEAEVSPIGSSNDIRYSPQGNEVTRRHTVTTGSTTGPELLETVRNTVSSAMYRLDPARESPDEPDQYSPAITPKSIHAGTLIYDPNGHLAIVYRIEENGRVLYIDAHPDNSLTRGVYDRRFVRSRPGMGAGFKNWRPIRLVHAERDGHGDLIGGEIVATPNDEIADYSLEQYFGNQSHGKGDWADARFNLNGEDLDYYDYVRAKLGGGSLHFDPLTEVRESVRSNCADLQYRLDAVNVSLQAGLAEEPHPERLPYNIYGTNGDWETYSTPSRDARLKTAFKELRDTVERFVRLQAAGDGKIVYSGNNLPRDLLAAYSQEEAACTVTYARSDESVESFGYEEARQRLFRMSFDPYNCVELRWGAQDPREVLTCRDGANKRAWYEAEQNLRNQIDRTYEARMDHDLTELKNPDGEGKGVSLAPDTDVRAYLAGVIAQ